jgi:multidrug efflux pump subunit AcrB
MKALFRLFAKRHMLANVFTILVILLGVVTLLQLKRDTFPNVDFGQVIITTRYPGASPKDVELNVTNKIESEIKGVSNIESITSYSMEDISVITVSIDVQADDKEQIKTDIRRAVNRVTDLPEQVRDAPTITELDNTEVPIIEVGIAGDVPYRQLRETARLFKKKLEEVNGVSRVREYWYLDPEVKVLVDPQQLKSLDLSLQEIANAIRTRNIRSTGGTFESYRSERNLVTLAQFEEPRDVANVVVRTTFNGPAIYVRDVADIEQGFEEPNILSRINGRPAITFQVLKREKADIIRTVDAINEFMTEQQDLMPEGVEILQTDDISQSVRRRFEVVLNNGGIGLVLVLIILALFLSVRTAFWVALGIPVALLGVIVLLPLMGAYLDIISLTAMLIVIGIIVDDGIIVAENIVRRRELGDDPLDAATNGLSQVAKPVFTTLITTFFAFAPLFFMPGVSGEFVKVIPLVISLALFISLFELTVALPAHLVPGLKRIKTEKKRNRSWFLFLRRIFEKILKVVLKLRYLYILLTVGLLIGSLWYARTYMSFILFPDKAADVFDVYVTVPVGTPLERTAERVKELEELILGLPDFEVVSFASKIGSHGEREPGEKDNWAHLRINLTPFADRQRTADQIVNALKDSTDAFENIELQYVIQAGGPPVGDPITIRVIGDDDGQRRKLVDAVIQYLNEMGGITDIERNDQLGKDQISVDLNYEELARLGLSVANVAQTIRIAYDGQVVTSIRYRDEDMDFRLLLTRRARSSFEQLKTLQIPNQQGRLIPLETIASFNRRPGPSSYYHYDGERTTTITAGISGEQITPIQATDRVLDHFDLDQNWTGMRFSIGGEAEETRESFQGLYFSFIFAVVAIYFVLVLLFNSLTQPFLVLVAIPFGILAVIIAFAIHNEPLGFLALMGLVGLTGVVVNDSLVMVDHINELEADSNRPMLDIVIEGTADRLRAIIMTTLTTVVGLLPLAYGLGGSDPFVAPMALALGYGLLFATPLTLFFVPSMIMVRYDFIRLFRRLAGKRSNQKDS